MNKEILIDKLAREHSLTSDEYGALIESAAPSLADYAAAAADKLRRKYYGTDVYIRGLIEVGNICRNDCLYCGIRASNKHCDRYILNEEQIAECCREGYRLGFRTFVLQGGEGAVPIDTVCSVVSEIRKNYPDCAITLSLGEYSRDDYKKMFDSGADRYLLRHETADKDHYKKLHPSSMSFENRRRCLYDLRDIGFQVGCGFMVGSPFQTVETLVKDLKFIEEFKPDMCGIGPFIPHKDTPFYGYPPGSASLTVFLLSLIRLIKPNILLPATTALGSIDENGRERGIKAGANVVMPNLSPISVRKKYELYNGKLCTGEEAAQCIGCLSARVASVGYKIVTARGDIIK